MKIIKTISFTFTLNDKTYDVDVIYKSGKKNITYRFKDNKFVITSPRLASLANIKNGLIKYGPRLLKYQEKPVLFNDDYVYILSKKVDLKNKVINFSDGSKFEFSTKDELVIFLKKYLLNIIKRLVLINCKKMNIDEQFNIKIKDMKSRYGSYSKKTKSLSFNLLLVHYDISIIESVVIHELAHHFVFDHSKKFYDLVLKYCPNYFYLDKKLKSKEVI